MLDECVSVSFGEYARKAAKVEAIRLEAFRLGFIRDSAKVGGALLSELADDVEVGIKQGDGLVGCGAGDGSTEEGEHWCRWRADTRVCPYGFGDNVRDFVIHAFVLTTDVQVFFQFGQEVVTCKVVVLLGEGEGIAIGDGAGCVVMTGKLIGERVIRIGFLNPNV